MYVPGVVGAPAISVVPGVKLVGTSEPNDDTGSRFNPDGSDDPPATVHDTAAQVDSRGRVVLADDAVRKRSKTARS